MVLEHLERDRPLTGDHGLVVVGVHEDQALFDGDLVGARLGVGELHPVLDHRRAEPSRLLDFVEGR